ncbi:DUF2213 domain-containing protein [Corticimicrobacter populi]|uniref:DUF2213 domain-containing protein n=1 Tax=Corticimicrobacter populi TaxID=2175229 RepID=A0A2V1K1S5_9BURK|nr:DUF2213 domain-containing protein [Corticimicrobacter populi]PWF25051.1 hypothetical protein DD235_02460 [Corticimicrobacter populi]
MSQRQTDVNGFLLVRNNPITKVGVFPYLGSEIGAPEPDKVYQVYRPQEELERPETIKSANLVPWINEHEFLGAEGTPAEKKGVQGTTGESAYFDYPYLRNNIRLYSESMQGLIDRGKVELSPSYRCRYEFASGEFEGQRYDAVQRDILFNHLASVDEGRTGPDLKVQDALTITYDSAEFINMEFTEEQLAQLRALIEQVLAEKKPAGSDNDTPKTGDEVDPDKKPSTDADPAAATAAAATPEEKEAAAKTVESAEGAAEMVELAQEAVAEAKEALEEVQEAAKEVEAAPTADGIKRLKDAMDGLKAARAKATKAADAVALAQSVSDLARQVAKGQDTGAIIKQMAEQVSARDALAKRVTPFIGAFDSAQMLSASDVAKYAVGKLGIKAHDGAEMDVLEGYLQAARPDSETIVNADQKPARAEDAAAKLWSEKK